MGLHGGRGQGALKKAHIDGKQIAGIGLSGQMHGLVITDAAGKPLRPSIIWNDQRTAPQAAEIEATVGGRKKLIELVGNVAMTSFTLTKLLWVRNTSRASTTVSSTCCCPRTTCGCA